MITLTRKNGGLWRLTVSINDEYVINLGSRESKQIKLPDNTEELNIDVRAANSTAGQYKIKHASKVKEIVFDYKMWGAIFFGMSPNIVCTVILQDGTEMELLNKKTGAEVDAYFNRVQI